MKPPTLAQVDREFVARKGLAEFIRLAWHQVEPGKLLWNWHIDAISERLEDIRNSRITNLLINVPPGCMKTLSVNVFFPAYCWTFEPEEDDVALNAATKFIAASYGQPLSDKSAKQHRDLVKSPWFQERWGDACHITDDSLKQVRMFENSARGFRFSTSVGGEVTGRHANVLIFDDLVKAQDADGRPLHDMKALEKANDFWSKTMASRESDPETTRRIGIMQRLHHADTAQLCIDSGTYEVLCLPMEAEPKSPFFASSDPRSEGEVLWPDRFSPAKIELLKKSLGSRTYASQYQQRPSPAEGSVFKREWLRNYWGLPGGKFEKLPEMDALFCQSWDCAFKDLATSDYVVGTVWMQFHGNFLLLDIYRKQTDITGTMKAIEWMSAKWPKATSKYIEDKANGPAVIQMLRHSVPGLIAVQPEGGKETRANAVQPLFEAGNVWLPDPSKYDWVEDYVEEMASFPDGRHDDQVDSTTQALLRMSRGNLHLYQQAMANVG